MQNFLRKHTNLFRAACLVASIGYVPLRVYTIDRDVKNLREDLTNAGYTVKNGINGYFVSRPDTYPDFGYIDTLGLEYATIGKELKCLSFLGNCWDFVLEMPDKQIEQVASRHANVRKKFRGDI